MNDTRQHIGILSKLSNEHRSIEIGIVYNYILYLIFKNKLKNLQFKSSNLKNVGATYSVRHQTN